MEELEVNLEGNRERHDEFRRKRIPTKRTLSRANQGCAGEVRAPGIVADLK
jgi:hypothetical protein